MINHALAKSTAFYAAGLVLLRYGHKNMEGVTGLLRQMPLVGGAMLLAGLALAGMPPFGLFVSEILITTAAYVEQPWVAYAFLGLLAVAFAALVYQVFRMVLGEPKEAGFIMTSGGNRFAAVSLMVNLMAMGYIGIHMPGFLRALFIPMTHVFHAMAEIP
jgi:hydrogenase-4 component F